MAAKRVVIIDYGLGNVYSVHQACLRVGFQPIVSANPSDIRLADALILPGVGAFGNAMDALIGLGLKQKIIDFAKSGKPMMGICLGMQLLFETSDEFGLHFGLGLVKGQITKFPNSHDGVKLRVPHIGWNKIFEATSPWDTTPLENLKSNAYMYFVHSYYAQPDEKKDILTISNYQEFTFCSGVAKDNIFGFQFHPEKSGEQGLNIYRKFLSL